MIGYIIVDLKVIVHVGQVLVDLIRLVYYAEVLLEFDGPAGGCPGALAPSLRLLELHFPQFCSQIVLVFFAFVCTAVGVVSIGRAWSRRASNIGSTKLFRLSIAWQLTSAIAIAKYIRLLIDRQRLLWPRFVILGRLTVLEVILFIFRRDTRYVKVVGLEEH